MCRGLESSWFTPVVNLKLTNRYKHFICNRRRGKKCVTTLSVLTIRQVWNTTNKLINKNHSVCSTVSYYKKSKDLLLSHKKLIFQVCCVYMGPYRRLYCPLCLDDKLFFMMEFPLLTCFLMISQPYKAQCNQFPSCLVGQLELFLCFYTIPSHSQHHLI